MTQWVRGLAANASFANGQQAIMSHQVITPELSTIETESTVWGRVYTGAAIAFALFLVLIALFRPTGGDVTVGSTLHLARESQNELQNIPNDRLRQAIINPEFVAQAVKGVDPALIEQYQQLVGSEWLSTLPNSIDVESDSMAPESINIHLSCKGPLEPFQLQLMQQLEKQLIVEFSTSLGDASASDTDEPSRVVAIQAVTKIDQLYAQADQYTQEHLASARAAFESSLKSFLASRVAEETEGDVSQHPVPSPTPIPAGSPGLPQVETVNQNRMQLESELHRLEKEFRSTNGASDRRDQRFARRRQIVELRESINEMPRTQPIPSDVIANPFVDPQDIHQAALNEESPPPFDADQSAALADSLVEELPRFDESAVLAHIQSQPPYQEIQQEIKLAIADRDAALAQLSAAKSQTSAEVTPVVSAQLHHRHHPRLSKLLLIGLALPCLAVGIKCALTQTVSDVPETFCSPEDVELWLDFPVIGSATTLDGPQIEQFHPPRTPRSIGVLRRCCEAFVCVAFLLVIICVMTEPHIGNELSSNPLGAYTQAVEFVIHSVF